MLLYGILTLLLISNVFLILIWFKQQRLSNSFQLPEHLIRVDERIQAITEQFKQLRESQIQYREEWLQQHHAQQIALLKSLQEGLQQGAQDLRHYLNITLTQHMDNTGKCIDKLSQITEERLNKIQQQVDQRLQAGFEKTTATFSDIVKRLALIDEAQKKISDLSSHVISLQEILSDKRSRGTFGEVQLAALIRNVIPENHFALQYTFKDGKRADCLLFLPEPTGNVVIDAKFPLENFRRLSDGQLPDSDKRQAEQQFRQDMRKHVQDIASKYIIPGETSDGAVMFIPAEAIFAEIHARFPEIVEEAHKARVWLASPTTMMAILTTARAVLKDAATRHQVHLIQEHLGLLAKDFDRFQKRMDNLARHIEQANTDVKDVKISADKISSRFAKIERVELSSTDHLGIDVSPPVMVETSIGDSHE